FLRQHEDGGFQFTIGATRRQFSVDYGVLGVDEEGILNRFDEKPKQDFLVSMGVYAMSKTVLDWIPENQAFGFDSLMRALLAAGQKVMVKEHSGYWLDIGRPDDYQRATDDFEGLKSHFMES